MRLISVRVVGRLLIRFVSASAVRIAIGASLTTSQAAIALQSGPAAIAQHSAPVVLAAAQTEGTTARPRGPTARERRALSDLASDGADKWQTL
jgi:hypothetical protein